MIKNFGYVSITMFDFNRQYDVYDQLKNDERISEEIKKYWLFGWSRLFPEIQFYRAAVV